MQRESAPAPHPARLWMAPAARQAQAILRRLGGLGFVGMDIVEVAPAYDVAEITALAGATMVWEYLALVGKA